MQPTSHFICDDKPGKTGNYQRRGGVGIGHASPRRGDNDQRRLKAGRWPQTARPFGEKSKHQAGVVPGPLHHQWGSDRRNRFAELRETIRICAAVTATRTGCSACCPTHFNEARAGVLKPTGGSAPRTAFLHLSGPPHPINRRGLVHQEPAVPLGLRANGRSVAHSTRRPVHAVCLNG